MWGGGKETVGMKGFSPTLTNTQTNILEMSFKIWCWINDEGNVNGVGVEKGD